ncbi:hypothetical protein ACJMK2_004964 [Sinanodonta woodiana]|uniref:Uncharacterized protein n=1 Tax=Sinanodonta woodiana TaxID=1069815 RepID=A0ABD3VR73_SINWO
MTSQSSLSGPLRHIGAQDALQLSPSIYGYVRVQRQMERMFKFMRWRRWFLIVSKGYMYIFKSEYSIKPRKIMHLNDYMKLMRLDSKELEQHGRVKWGFKILPHEEYNMIPAFACVSDEDRRRWMRCLRLELSSANDAESPPYPEDVTIEEEYVYLETSVAQKRPPAPVPGKKPRPPAPSPVPASTSVPNNTSNSDGDEDYTSINEEELDNIQKPKKNVPKYKPAPPTEEKIKMSPQHDVLTKEMYEFNGSNRDEVQRLLEDKPDGTFLVRKARNTDNQVLSIEIDCQLKEFKINELDGKVTIDSSLYFPTVEKLLIHYTKNNLPNKNTKLTQGCFFTKKPGYVNERL